MVVFLNGEFVPEERAVVSIFDRGFLYGDGLFETIRLSAGRPFRWDRHLDRLRRGAEFLRITIPFDPRTLRAGAMELARRNELPEGTLRLTVSRGVGPRGYSPKGARSPTVAMTMHPLRFADESNPPRVRVMTSSFRLPSADPLGAFKTANKLVQVLARAEADDRGMDEALLIDASGEVVEAASSNVFWIEGGAVSTTPLASGALPGVAREVVLELCRHQGIAVAETPAAPARLQHADGMILTNSGLGIVEVGELDGKELKGSPLIPRIQAAYRELMEAEVQRG